MSNKVKIVLICLAAVLIIILVGVIAYLAKQNKQLRSASQTPVATVTIVTLSPTATPSRTSTTTRTVTSTPTATPSASVDDLVKAALASKFNTSSDQIAMTISKRADNSVFGGVTIGEEQSGGWFVAAKKDGEWKVIADGNGTISCSSLEGYDVATSVVSECWDEQAGDLVKR